MEIIKEILQDDFEEIDMDANQDDRINNDVNRGDEPLQQQAQQRNTDSASNAQNSGDVGSDTIQNNVL